MKKPRFSFCIATLAAAVFHFAAVPQARADDESDRTAIEDLLTAGSWKITFEKGWSLVRVFDKGGTFATPNRPDESGKWKISGKMVIQTFTDGRKDVFTLPLNEKGTAGIAKDGETLTAVHDNHMPPAIVKPGAEMDQRDKELAAATLAAAPWKITAGTWSTVRVFDRNGTFSTQGSPERGKWKMADGMVTLVFADGHKDFLILPIDPKGTAVALETGEPATAVQMYVSPLDAGGGLSPSSLDLPPMLAPTPTPARPSAPMALDGDARAANEALLISAPWKISGGGWTAVRVFEKNGTFTTIAHEDSHGRWRITGATVILTFTDGHKDTLSLPLDPKGTAGTDEFGGPTNAVLVENPLAGKNATPARGALATPAISHPGADEQPKDPTVAMLVAAPWRFTTQGSSEVRVFAKDGTFTTIDKADGNGRWTMTKDLIILSYPNGHKDALSLPLNPRGTTGMADDGNAITGVQVDSAAGNSPAAPAPPPIGMPAPSSPAHPFGTTSPQ